VVSGDLLSWSVVIGLALAALGLVLLLVLAWWLGRAAGRKKAAGFDGAAKVTASMPAAPDRRVVAAGFAATVRRLRGVLPGPDWPYAVPWVLLLGSRNSGRSTLAAAVDLHRPFTLPAGSVQADNGCVWHAFEPGILLEPTQGVLWGGGDPGRNQGGTAVGWQHLMNLLLRYRRERGIDGVVITVSCDGLLAADATAAVEQAGLLRERLRELQQYLGLRIPVYLVVTKCDLVAGFPEFWQPLVAERGRQMFGWSNDETPETSYGPHLIPRAFDELGRTLHRILLSQAVQGDGIADLTFLFPAEFQKLAEPVGRFANRLFHVDAYQDPHFFRGVYFTGDVPGRESAPVVLSAPADIGAGSPATGVAGTGIVIDQTTPHPRFITDLLSEKVFREGRLIQPARRGLVARGRAMRLRWAVLVVMALFLGLGTWWSFRTLQASAQRVIPLVLRIAVNNRIDEGADHTKVKLGGSVLEAYRTISRHALVAPFMPASWFSPLESKVETALANGFELVVFRPMDLELTARATALVTIEPQAPGTAPGPEVFRTLVSNIAAFDKLAVLVELYNRANRLNADELSWLVRTLLHVDITDTLRQDPKLFGDVMSRVIVEQFGYEPWVARANAALAARVRAAAQLIEAEGVVVRPFQELADAIERTEEARFADPLTAATRLKTLAQKLQQVQQSLDAPDLGWRFTLHPEQDAFWVGQMSNVRGNPFLGPAAADDMLAVLTGKVAGLRTLLQAIKVAGIGPLLVADDQADGRLRLTPSLEALAQALPPLLAYDFLSNPVHQPVDPYPRANLVMWSPEPLDRAVAYESSFKEMEAGPLTRVPESLRPMIMAVAAQSLQGAMLSAVADAEVLEKREENFRQFGEEEGLLREARQFGRAAVSLDKVLTALQTRGFDQAYTTVANIVGRHSLAMLEQADTLLGQSGAWMPVDQFRSWDGTLPMNFEGYQVLSDAELDQTLKTNAARIDWLASEIARPVVGALQGDAVPAPLRRHPRVVRWLRILEDLERYKASNPASTLAGLERFIRTDLAAIKPGVCPDASDEGASGVVDFFTQTRSQIRRLALAQCHRIAGDTVKTDFGRLATDFNNTLAGRYPFAAGTAVDTPEAGPDAVVGFLERFSPEVEAAIRRGLGTPASGSANAAALLFLDRMAVVRDFLAPLLAPATTAPTPAALEVEAEFRVNRPRESGGNQIIDWGLSLGDQQLVRGGEAKTARWRPGDPVTLRLRWAKDAPVVPVAVVGGDGRIDADRALVVAYVGQWGLIRLLQNHAAPAADLPGLVDRLPRTLKFSADTGNVPVADAPEPARPKLVGQTSVFVRVSVLAASADGKTRRVVPLPVFPFSAPRLASGLAFSPTPSVEASP